MSKFDVLMIVCATISLWCAIFGLVWVAVVIGLLPWFTAFLYILEGRRNDQD